MKKFCKPLGEKGDRDFFTYLSHIIITWLSNVSMLLLGGYVPSQMLGRRWNKLLEMGLGHTFLLRLLESVLCHDCLHSLLLISQDLHPLSQG